MRVLPRALDDCDPEVVEDASLIAFPNDLRRITPTSLLFFTYRRRCSLRHRHIGINRIAGIRKLKHFMRSMNKLGLQVIELPRDQLLSGLTLRWC